MMKRALVLLVVAGLVVAQEFMPNRRKGFQATATGSAAMVNPNTLAGNMQLLVLENLGTQSDGATITTARRYTNDASATGSRMYSYGSGLITNNVQNSKGGVWWGETASSCLLMEETPTISNYLSVITARIDSAQVAGNIVISFGNALQLVIDSTRTNWLALKVRSESGYRLTNQFTRGVPFTFGVWRQGTNLVAWRETGQVETTNAISAALDTSINYGLFGNAFTAGSRPVGFQFDFLMNTNSAMDGTNLPAVVYFHTNRFAIH